MPRGSSTTSSRVATCADYNSDDGEIHETRKQANVAAKRSGGLGRELDSPAMDPVSDSRPIPDRASDSGYSSRTQVTDVSADSSQSVKGEHASTATSEILTATSSGCSSVDHKTEREGRKSKSCKDPNCPKRHKSSKSKHPKSEASSSKAPSTKASSTKASSSKKSSKSTKTSTKQSSSSTAREPSPRQQPTRPREVVLEPHLRPPMRPRASSAHDPRRQSMHPGFGYPRQPGPPVSYVTRGYPVYPGGPQGHPGGPPPGPHAHMIVNYNRGVAERPLMPPRVSTEISARGPRPVGPYGRPVLRQDTKQGTVISARTVSKPKYSNNALESDGEGYFDQEQDSDDFPIEDDSEEDSDEDEPPISDALTKLQRYQAQQQAEAERRRKSEMEAHLRAIKAQQDSSMMPPPQKPASGLKGISMRQAGTSHSPKITYNTNHRMSFDSDDEMAEQIRQMTLASRPSPNPLVSSMRHPYTSPALDTMPFMSAESARQAHNPRASYYGGESLSDLEDQHRAFAEAALISQSVQIGRQKYELQRNAEATQNYDPQRLREQLNSARFRRPSTDENTPRPDSRLQQAQIHIDRTSAVPGHAQTLTETTLRQAEIDAAKYTNGSRSGSQGHGISARNPRRMSTSSQSQVETVLDTEPFKMKLNPDQPYEFDVKGQRVELRPDGDGYIDFVYVSEKRESGFPSTSSSASRLGRQNSQRRSSRYEIDGEEITDDEPRRHRSRSRRDPTRRRAETVTTYEPSETSSRRTARRAPSQDDEYRGPPMYGVSSDEYGRPIQNNRYSGNYSFEPQSPRQGYSSNNTYNAGRTQNHPGFGA